MTTDFMPGDPARYVIGRSEEKPARRHGRQKRKPKTQPLQFEERLLRDIRKRKEALAPLVQEVPKLEQAQEILKGIKKPKL
jgi:hypothetical protein